MASNDRHWSPSTGETVAASNRRTVGSGFQRAGTRSLVDGVIRGSANAPLIGIKRHRLLMLVFPVIYYASINRYLNERSEY